MAKKKIIEFRPARPEIEGVFDPPVPAVDLIPDWYKSQEGYVNNEKSVNPDGSWNHTIRHCMPVFDAMTSGYIITVPQDINVSSNEDGTASMSWPSSIFEQIASHSPQQISKLPFDHNIWDATAWKFNNPWIIQTPPGYSCLFTSPIWRDLPFQCLTGIVDTDKYTIQQINFPFFIKKDFRGVIETGTPMIQVIPFRRDKWDHVTKTKSSFDMRLWERSKRRMGHRYKKDYRERKEYR